MENGGPKMTYKPNTVYTSLNYKEILQQLYSCSLRARADGTRPENVVAKHLILKMTEISWFWKQILFSL